MREYLFHGKRTDNDEWVEGYLFTRKNTLNEIIDCFIIQDAYEQITNGQRYVRSNLGYECFRVIPESVGEWTGVYDINKRKIFENDIVRTQPFTDRPYSSKAKSKQHIGVVEYCRPELRGNHFKQKVYDAKWKVKVKDYGKYVCSNWSDFFDCEVIGNVFENADLLEG